MIKQEPQASKRRLSNTIKGPIRALYSHSVPLLDEIQRKMHPLVWLCFCLLDTEGIYLFNFYWSIVDLQRHSSFCSTTKWSVIYRHLSTLLKKLLSLVGRSSLWVEFSTLYGRSFLVICFMGSRWFPGASDGKESVYHEGDPGSIPVTGRSPGEGTGCPCQSSCLENSKDRGAWQATVRGIVKSWTWLSDQCFYV